MCPEEEEDKIESGYNALNKAIATLKTVPEVMQKTFAAGNWTFNRQSGGSLENEMKGYNESEKTYLEAVLSLEKKVADMKARWSKAKPLLQKAASGEISDEDMGRLADIDIGDNRTLTNLFHAASDLRNGIANYLFNISTVRGEGDPQPLFGLMLTNQEHVSIHGNGDKFAQNKASLVFNPPANYSAPEVGAVAEAINTVSSTIYGPHTALSKLPHSLHYAVEAAEAAKQLGGAGRA